MIRRDFAGRDAAGGFGDIDRGFKVMADREQFLHRINDRDFMAARLKQRRHNSD